MSKWCGVIGFSETVEYEPGLWEPGIIEKNYFGEVFSNNWKRENSGRVNDDINLSNQISIVADPYILYHCSTIAYVEFMGNKWKVTNIDVQYPRLILTVGGVYNGNSTGTSD